MQFLEGLVENFGSLFFVATSIFHRQRDAFSKDRGKKVDFTPERLALLMDTGESFFLKKHDISTTVGLIKGDVFGSPYNFLIKRFNHKGFFDYMLKLLFGSKVRRLFNISKRLYERGLPVPRPVIYFEPTFKMRHSFFLSSVIENSESLYHAYKRGLLNKRVARQLANTVATWHIAGAVHGDLKWSNILMQEDHGETRFFFVDLDQTKLYSRPKIEGIIKDLARFYRYGLELDASDWVDKEFFPEYMLMLPDHLKNKLDLAYIRKKALRDWDKKGRRRYNAK